MPHARPFDESPDFVQSLARGLQVLRAFDHTLPQASLSEIADRTGLARAVVRRNLLTLQQENFSGGRVPDRQMFTLTEPAGVIHH